MASAIESALEVYKAQVVEAARTQLALLKDKADAEVLGAVAKLEGLVLAWQKAAERLNGMGLASIADIALSGGQVWVFEAENHYDYDKEMPQALHDLMSTRNSRRPTPQIVLRKATYEVFVLIVPKGSQEKG